MITTIPRPYPSKNLDDESSYKTETSYHWPESQDITGKNTNKFIIFYWKVFLFVCGFMLSSQGFPATLKFAFIIRFYFILKTSLMFEIRDTYYLLHRLNKQWTS